MTRHITPLYSQLASTVDARLRCIATGNAEWKLRHRDTIDELCKQFMPHGSGVDSGVTLNLDDSTGERLVFDTAYHHMNENGFYDGWTEHRVIVKPSLTSGLDLRLTGRDRNDIKDYLAEILHHALKQGVWWEYVPGSDGEREVMWHSDAYGPPVEEFCCGGGI